ncbi:MAG: metallophosphoesterase [Planctomycetales bacterium]|nr:metallophosphoesterase [Planctomycetales bacterium]
MSTLVLVLAVLIALAGHGFLWFAAVNRLHSWAGPRWIVESFTRIGFVVACVLPLAAAWQLRPENWHAWAPFNETNWASGYLWLCLVIGSVTLAWKPWSETRRYDPRVQRAHASEVTDVAAVLGERPLYGRKAKFCDLWPWNETLTLSVDLRQLEIPRLPLELERLTVAHISDLHMTGRIGLGFYEQLVAQVDALRPDVVAITGDIVENEECWPWLAETLGRLTAPLGVYFILGNHDEFIATDRTRELLADAGLICLSGRTMRTEWNGVPTVLLGNESPWLPPAPDVSGLPARGELNQFRLALIHTPDQFGWCRKAGVDLALAGHTHGGQVQFPILGPIASPSRFGAKYACGVFRRGETVLHVTRGVASKTPLRWRCPPEIALLELTGPRSAATTPTASGPHQSAPLP